MFHINLCTSRILFQNMCYAFQDALNFIFLFFSAPLTASSKRTRLDLGSEGSEIDETEGSSSDDESDDDTIISNTVEHKQTQQQTGKVF